MPIISAAQARTEYDVAIIGSGAGGGQMAYTLTLAGLKCVMLEAGRNYDPMTETPMFQRGDQAPLRGEKTPEKNFGFYDATIDGGWGVRVSLTRRLRRKRRSSSSGGGHACSAGAPITGAASRCAMGPTTSSPALAMGWALTGR